MVSSSPRRATRCPACGSRGLEAFFELSGVPVYCNRLWPSREAARTCPRGDIRLACCRRCGLITNVAFDPARLEYTGDYENSLHFSPRFQEYARSLAGRLVDRYDLHGKLVIEIGCGKGDFLRLLSELGGNRGLGFDPGYLPQPADHHDGGPRIHIIPDSYSERYAGYHGDLICCRQTLEHIADPGAFLAAVRRNLGDRLDTAVFFEVPNALYTLRNLAIWDIIYEHCSYFTPASLREAFSSHGFAVDEVTEEFEGQFLGITAVPAPTTPARPAAPSAAAREQEPLAQETARFATRFRSKVGRWKRHLQEVRSRGRRALVWGAGSKGVTFLNVVDPGDEISAVVDINPRKQNMYVAGTGHPIVSPESLRGSEPDVVLVMNAVYVPEIRRMAAALGWHSEFRCV
jgi:SAM-dependent methyltransferase